MNQVPFLPAGSWLPEAGCLPAVGGGGCSSTIDAVVAILFIAVAMIIFGSKRPFGRARRLVALAFVGAGVVHVLAFASAWTGLPLLQHGPKAVLALSAVALAYQMVARRRPRHPRVEPDDAASLTPPAAPSASGSAMDAGSDEKTDAARQLRELRFLLAVREDLQRRGHERSTALEAANTRLAREVAERERAEQALRLSIQRLESFVTNSPLGVVEWNVAPGRPWVIERWTGRSEAILGWPPDEAIGRTAVDLGFIADSAPPGSLKMFEGAPRRARLTLRCRTHSGDLRICSWYHAELPGAGGEPDRVFSLVEDVTDRALALERAEHLASHDPLTGLANRSLFSDRLDLALAGRGASERVAVAMMDFDRFKQVNDTYGHRIGDLLLVEVASRLKGRIGPDATLARLGGDELVVVASGLRDRWDAEALAQHMLAALHEPFDLDGNEIMASLSVGLALCPDHGTIAESLLAAADLALYRAKRAGRGRASLYDEDQDGPLTATPALRRA